MRDGVPLGETERALNPSSMKFVLRTVQNLFINDSSFPYI